MLQTLIKIGEWQSQGKSEWDRFLEKPKILHEDKKGNKITQYVLPIIFDLDAGEVIVESENLREYRESDVENLKSLSIQGGNNKAIYVTVPPNKLIQLYKTFFGKEDDKNGEIELLEAIKKTDQSLLTEYFKDLLEEIFKLKTKVLEKFQYYNENKDEYKIDFKSIEKNLELAKNENVALVYLMIKAEQYGFSQPVEFSKIDDYLAFLNKKFIKQEGKNYADEGKLLQKVCYANGELAFNVNELNLNDRYSLNKMFVTETKNYASLFNGKLFNLNYQVSSGNQEKLDYASKFLLNNFKTRIANIDHVIIPQFRNNEKVDWELALTGIKRKSDLLFSFDSLESFSKNIEDEIEQIYWINFVAFESDGNFFKSTEIIKDVSKFHFNKVIKVFNNINWQFKEETFADWNNVMKEYGKTGRLNFNSIYGLIPLRKDKEKKNKALDLFKMILENRKVDNNILFDYFSELILCHYYERYRSYTNIASSSKDYFYFSVRNSVFKYLAFFQVLKKLKLIDMKDHEIIQSQNDETPNKYEKAIRDFFDKMELNQNQQAIFYLGRMLNAVEYIQVKKKIKKTVINLVNFNGIDRDDIERLRNDLINKARQHGQVGKVIFTSGKFSELFDYNNWKMRPTEALFFLLTGYSFGTNKSDEVARMEVELEEENV
mgnify:CR=1 FL=1